MCSRLTQGFMNQDIPVTLENMLGSYIADVTTKYAFDMDFEYLKESDFASPFVRVIRSFKVSPVNFGVSCGVPWMNVAPKTH